MSFAALLRHLMELLFLFFSIPIGRHSHYLSCDWIELGVEVGHDRQQTGQLVVNEIVVILKKNCEY